VSQSAAGDKLPGVNKIDPKLCVVYTLTAAVLAVDHKEPHVHLADVQFPIAGKPLIVAQTSSAAFGVSQISTSLPF
jgi:hypothetical protein